MIFKRRKGREKKIISSDLSVCIIILIVLYDMKLKQLLSLIYVSSTYNAFKRLRVVTHYNKKVQI